MDPKSLSAAGMSPTQLGPQGVEQMKAGGALEGIGSIFSGISGFAQARYQSQVAKINERIALYNQENAIIKGESDALRYGLQASQRMGGIKAAQGSSGVDVNSGSAKDVQTSQAMVTQMDLDQIRQNAARVAYDYSTQRVGFQNQAKLYNMAGITSLASGGINALSSFVGSSASVHSKWLQGAQAGMFPTNTNDQSDVILGGVGINSIASGSNWGS